MQRVTISRVPLSACKIPPGIRVASSHCRPPTLSFFLLRRKMTSDPSVMLDFSKGVQQEPQAGDATYTEGWNSIASISKGFQTVQSVFKALLTLKSDPVSKSDQREVNKESCFSWLPPPLLSLSPHPGCSYWGNCKCNCTFLQCLEKYFPFEQMYIHQPAICIYHTDTTDCI